MKDTTRNQMTSAIELLTMVVLHVGVISGAVMAQDSHSAKPKAVATFDGPMLTGVTVSKKGRVFVNFPRWGDDAEFTVAKIVDEEAHPFPSAEFNRLD